MGGISEGQVEWAVVHRLKAMLDHPPKTEFNVTQTFAHFTAILLWTAQRLRVQDAIDPADYAAQRVWAKLQEQAVTDAPWRLSRKVPRLPRARVLGVERDINAAFDGMPADQFIIWLRNALAHGDGRSIRPIHKMSLRSGKELLAGFEFVERRGQRRGLQLYHQDMIRIGKALADTFCKALSHGDEYFEREAGTQVVEKAA
jgi:hypothetical protein